jgi:hypothetical protein
MQLSNEQSKFIIGLNSNRKNRVLTPFMLIKLTIRNDKSVEYSGTFTCTQTQ